VLRLPANADVGFFRGERASWRALGEPAGLGVELVRG
jgi:hypothetical protein